MTRWAEVSPFTGKRPEKLMAAIFAFDPGKTAMQIPTVQIPVDHIQRIGTPIAVPACIARSSQIPSNSSKFASTEQK
jgi:hypothetical protein